MIIVIAGLPVTTMPCMHSRDLLAWTLNFQLQLIITNPVSVIHECLTDSRHRASVGVLPTVAVKEINPTIAKQSETKLFMLHNVDIQQFSCPENVRRSLLTHLAVHLIILGIEVGVGAGILAVAEVEVVAEVGTVARGEVLNFAILWDEYWVFCQSTITN